jgi:hypothetical protein
MLQIVNLLARLRVASSVARGEPIEGSDGFVHAPDADPDAVSLPKRRSRARSGEDGSSWLFLPPQHGGPSAPAHGSFDSGTASASD